MSNYCRRTLYHLVLTHCFGTRSTASRRRRPSTTASDSAETRAPDLEPVVPVTPPVVVNGDWQVTHLEQYLVVVVDGKRVS